MLPAGRSRHNHRRQVFSPYHIATVSFEKRPKAIGSLSLDRMRGILILTCSGLITNKMPAPLHKLLHFLSAGASDGDAAPR